MKRAHLNLLMLLASGSLAAGLYVSRDKPVPDTPLLSLSADEIHSIVVAHPDEAAIVLERRGDGWHLTAPVEWPADEFEVASLLNLAQVPVRRPIADDVDAAAIGLSPPDYVIQLNDVELQFGGIEPLSYQRFVRVDEARVALIDNPPGSALDADYSDLIAKALLPIDARIERIELPDFTVERAEPGWTLRGDTVASADQLAALTEGWRTAQAMWNAAALDVDPAVNDQVHITLADGRRLSWIVARREPQLELIRADLKVQYTLSRALVDTLLTLPAPDPLEPPEASETDP